MKGPKILVLDIETSPLLAHVWGLWDQNVGLNMIESEWHIMSFAAKWLGDPISKVIYHDQEGKRDITNDKVLLKKMWKLLDECDILIGQNSKSFDHKKMNARFILNGMEPPSSYRHIDTMRLAKKHFAFTSNKLAFLTDKLCTKHKKLSHAKFSGFVLWKACMDGNSKAWKEMREYNVADIMSTEELYYKLIAWDNSLNFNTYYEGLETVCTCGGTKFQKNGTYHTNGGMFQRFRCTNCGSELKGKTNMLSKEKKASLKGGTQR